MAKNTPSQTKGNQDSGLSDLLGQGQSATAGSLVDQMSAAPKKITLSLSDYPDLQGKNKGDQVDVTISGTITSITADNVTIEPTPSDQTDQGLNQDQNQNSPPALPGQ